jgi:enterochelin esterase-like enzyme
VGRMGSTAAASAAPSVDGSLPTDAVQPVEPARTGRLTNRIRRPMVAVAIVAVVVGASIVTGITDASNSALMLMGFDSDRAQLITSLLIAAGAAAGATLAANRKGLATLAALGGVAVLYGPTFMRESGDALASTGVNGSFDTLGWLQTLMALLVVATVTNWAGAAVAQALRPGLVEAGSGVREAVRERRLDLAHVKAPLTVVLVIILLVAALPIFGDMVNYTPDARMLHGAQPLPVLNPASTIGSAQPTAHSPSPHDSSSPAATVDAVGPAGSGSPNARPWLTWRPTGAGSVTQVRLPAPWKGGSTAVNTISVYTPPGYDPAGSRRYLVLYEAPFDYGLWDSSVNIKVALDTLIDRGTIPPLIVVFVGTAHSPMPDTECANSIDGRVWMDTFISQTVVSYVDSHYHTVALARARATTGFSQGGYCAAVLVLRHPSVFGTAISVSGYYLAGGLDSNAKAPFRGSLAALVAASPLLLAAQLPVADRAGLYFIVVAKHGQPIYGLQAKAFERALASGGYSYKIVDARLPHGWDQVRQLLPGALEDWAAHLAAAGVL